MALGYGLPTCNNNNNCATLQLRCVDVHVYSVRTCRQEQGWRWRSAIHILGLSGCCACYEGCHVRRCYRCCGAQAPAVAAPMTAAGHCFFFSFFWVRKLTCPSMPILSATRKTDKANHRRVSGPQHIL